MIDRKYSLDEIDRMREAVQYFHISNWTSGERLDRIIEDQLRTYMTAGIDPAELEAKAAPIKDKMFRGYPPMSAVGQP
jgi:hypothetical protein